MINDDKWLDNYGDNLVAMCKYIDLHVNNINKMVFHWLDNNTINIIIDNLGIVLPTNKETSIYGNRMLEEYFYSFENLITSTRILIMGGIR